MRTHSTLFGEPDDSGDVDVHNNDRDLTETRLGTSGLTTGHTTYLQSLLLKHRCFLVDSLNTLAHFNALGLLTQTTPYRATST
jgi:hypothetical protein